MWLHSNLFLLLLLTAAALTDSFLFSPTNKKGAGVQKQRSGCCWLDAIAIRRGGALEIDATMEVVGGAGRIGSLFLREEGAIAVPRGVVPGCLSSTTTGCPIIVAIPSIGWKNIYDLTTDDGRRQDDLVWVGNGLLSDFQQNATVILPHFGVLQVNADPTTSIDSPPTYVYGKHAHSMADILQKRGIQTVQVVDSWGDMCLFATRKLLWASCLWLLCHDTNSSDPQQPITVSLVHAEKQDQLEQLVHELMPALQKLTDGGSTNETAVLSYMTSYSLSMPHAIPSKKLALAELKDRNGVFFHQLDIDGHHHQPFHCELLERVAGRDAMKQLLKNYDESDPIPKQQQKLVNLPDASLVCFGQAINGDDV
jgi:hypothetical protein